MQTRHSLAEIQVADPLKQPNPSVPATATESENNVSLGPLYVKSPFEKKGSKGFLGRRVRDYSPFSREI